mmetsp:Transcript_31163/g.93432  ORF Transcript_31163/g.93432 Transcript_31163/m.93432 type:complete len:93 (-) Transcript_31163:71-349(-)
MRVGAVVLDVLDERREIHACLSTERRASERCGAAIGGAASCQQLSRSFYQRCAVMIDAFLVTSPHPISPSRMTHPAGATGWQSRKNSMHIYG